MSHEWRSNTANEVQKAIEPVRPAAPELIRRQEQGPVQGVAPQAAYRRVQCNRSGLRPADLLALQRAVGNRGVQRVVASHVDHAADEQQVETTGEDAERTVQTKPAVGAPADLYAQAAAYVAGQVMTVAEAATQRPNRTGLPDGLKSGVESLSGMSLDSVNVHYNSSQPAQLNALAYTQGDDIHVAPGQEQHLPHEAWHVVQQAQGRVKPTTQMKDGVPIKDDAGLEHEADVLGAKALAPTVHLRGGLEEEELLQSKLAPAQRMAPEQGGAKEHARKSRSDQQRGRPAALRSAAPSASAMTVDTPSEAIAQREVGDAARDSKRVSAQTHSVRAVLGSSRVVVQGRQLTGLFGQAAQLRPDPTNAFYRPMGGEVTTEPAAQRMRDGRSRANAEQLIGPANQYVPAPIMGVNKGTALRIITPQRRGPRASSKSLTKDQ